MKRQLVLAWLASGLALTLIPFALVLKSGVSASNLKPPPAHELAHLGASATVHSAGHGAPWMNLTDGRDVLTAYSGEAEALRLLQQKPAEPFALAAGDFDEDGMPDLISAYAAGTGAVMSLHRGNVDAMFPNSPEAKQRKQRGEFTDAPFLSPAMVFRLPERPDFLGAGDFNADGHADVALSALGSNMLYVLPGDGAGRFGSPVSVPLSGKATAMITGETSIVVGVAGTDGPKLLVFESSLANPETISLADEAPALAIGRFDDISESEIAAAAGNSLLIIRRTDGGSARPWQKVIQRTFDFSIKSFAVGNFSSRQTDDLAMLCDDGGLRILSHPSELSSAPIVGSPALEGVTHLIAARVSSLPLDTIVAVNPGAHLLHLFAGNADAPADVSTTLDVEGEPVAALPMRLNGDALSDLVILRKGQVAPTVMVTPAVMIFTVTNTGDNGGVNPPAFTITGTLRQAIVDANANAGADTINFNIPGSGVHTINLLAPLPMITETVTIDGTTQPGFSGTPVIELNGASAGGGADGLSTLSASNAIKGLDINSFGSGFGISLRQLPGNVVQGNFIGTDPTGAIAKPNNMGLMIASGNNTIGGTTAAARNVISGNSSSGISANSPLSSGNLIRGNFIGTTASGAGSLANGAAGIAPSNGSNNSIGGTSAGAGNVIAFNKADGVLILLETGDAVLGNSIFSNVGLGINLNDDGVTANDPCDPDTGANNSQNFPVLTSATTDGGNTAIAGTLNSTLGFTFRIEFFSSPACDPSGNGEGQTFLGATTVGAPVAAVNRKIDVMPCEMSFNVNLPVAVPPGNVITATATDPANNTSEFSACVTVVFAPCTITCPPDQVRSSSPTQCGTAVTYPAPVASAACGAVACNPSSGSFFGAGTTTVTCTTANGPTCSFSVTVVDNTPPNIRCPAPIITSTDPGQASAAVSFTATATDNCPGVSVTCAPPSGSRFPAGTTIASCTATDGSGNTASCFFSVTVVDREPPVIKCPANVSADAGPTQCSAVVTYPAPMATDNVPGVTAACSPASGTTFQVGVTTVTCTATDVARNKAACTFTVNLTGGPTQAVITPASVDLRAVKILSLKAKKRTATGEFSIQNTGCGRLTLTFKAVTRVTDQSKLSDTNDSAFFSFFRRAPDGSPTGPNLLGQQVTIDAGAANQQTFVVMFLPPGPPADRGSSPLRAVDVVPSSFQSMLSFTGTDKTVTFNAGAKPGVQLIDPLVSICRSGDQFVITFHVYDSDKTDVTTATFEFLDSSDRVIGTIPNVDLTGPISKANIVNGQSFTVIQNTTVGDRVSKVRVTIFGGSSIDSATSNTLQSTCGASAQSISPRRQVTLPVLNLDALP